MGARRELADARPAGAQAVPDAAERPDRRELPRPVALGVQERPGIASLEPEQERVRRRKRAVRPQAGRGSSAVERAPREDRERGSSATATGRVSRASPHASPAPRKRRAFCGQERDDREHEVERLAVDGLEEERHREQREVEHGPSCAVGSDLVLRRGGRGARTSPGPPRARRRSRRARSGRGGHVRAGRQPPGRAGRRPWPSWRGARSRARRSGGSRRCPSAPRRR